MAPSRAVAKGGPCPLAEAGCPPVLALGQIFDHCSSAVAHFLSQECTGIGLQNLH